MKQNWTEQELVEFWTLTDSEKQLLEQRTESGRLGYAVLIKFFRIEGRFPLYNKEAPQSAIDFLANQLNSSASVWLDFPLKGSSSERARLGRAKSAESPANSRRITYLKSASYKYNKIIFFSYQGVLLFFEIPSFLGSRMPYWSGFWRFRD